MVHVDIHTFTKTKLKSGLLGCIDTIDFILTQCRISTQITTMLYMALQLVHNDNVMTLYMTLYRSILYCQHCTTVLVYVTVSRQCVKHQFVNFIFIAYIYMYVHGVRSGIPVRPQVPLCMRAPCTVPVAKGGRRGGSCRVHVRRPMSAPRSTLIYCI